MTYDEPWETPSGLPAPGDLDETEVHIWRILLDSKSNSQVDALQSVLSTDERTRAASFRFDEDRQRFVAGRALLRRLIASYTASDPARLTFTVPEKNGKPRVVDQRIQFNVAHSQRIVLIAFARSRWVGVDVEHVRAMKDFESISESNFASAEHRALMNIERHEDRQMLFMKLWTGKEAAVKAIGEGLRYPLSKVVLPTAGRTHNHAVPMHDGPWSTRAFFLSDIDIAPGYVGAIVVEGNDAGIRRLDLPW